MRVKLSELREITDVLLAHLEDMGLRSIDLRNEYYWDIQAPERYDVYTDPGKPTIGNLGDHWSELERMLGNPEDVHPYALVWLAALLRYAGEEAINQAAAQDE
jgi:hypothetical protein